MVDDFQGPLNYHERPGSHLIILSQQSQAGDCHKCHVENMHCYDTYLHGLLGIYNPYLISF